MQREWRVMGYEDEYGDFVYDREQMASAMVEAEGILARMGGAIVIGSIREETSPGNFEPRGLAFRYDSFVPAQRRPVEAVETPEPEPDPEPVAA